MKLFLYYAAHSFVNQLKKLMKTWVMILIIAMFVLGIIFGLVFALLDRAIEDIEPPEPADPDTSETEHESGATMPSFTGADGSVIYTLTSNDILDISVSAVILLTFVLSVATFDRGSIFLPADTVLLFTAPIKPARVLAFRLACGMGAVLMVGVYFLFQIPNLIANTSFGAATVFMMAAGLMLAVTGAIAVKTVVYIVSAGSPARRRAVRTVLFALLGAAAVGLFVYRRSAGIDSIALAAVKYVTSVYSRYIPLIGWCKGTVLYVNEGRPVAAAVCGAATLAGTAVLFFVSSRLKNEFYEDAAAKAEEVAELQRAAAEKRSGIFGAGKKRGKDRADRVRRDIMTRGSGASVYFFKEIFNRFRFSFLGIFNGSAVTCLVLGAGVSVILRIFTEFRSMIPAALVLAVICFFRTLGNPLRRDTELHYFAVIPEPGVKKVFWSLLGGLAGCALDLVLPLAISAVLMSEPFYIPFAWFGFIISVVYYSSCVGAFVGLSVPVNAGTTIKQTVQLLFVYFGLVPDILILALIGTFVGIAPAAAAAALLNFAVGTVFFALIPGQIVK